MGAMNSIHQKLKEFSDAEEEDVDYHNTSTPQRTYKPKCVIGVDPRSPTENIDRTPIIVNGTPITRLSKDVKSKIISQNKEPIDPRSPTIDFSRTPLSLGTASSNVCDTPLKAPVAIAQPTTDKDTDDVLSTTDKPFGVKLSAEEILFDLLDNGTPTSRGHTDSILSTDSSLADESFDTAPLLEGTERLTLGNIGDNKKSGLSDQDNGMEDSFSSQSKLRCRPVNRILNQHTPILKPRSPLASVNNSPRTTILSKKSVTSDKSLDAYTNPSGVAIDKENLCH